jgi:3-hydroxyisobutyrate dehydrogenase-like beta-hydroxyacid dehydrogenase
MAGGLCRPGEGLPEREGERVVTVGLVHPGRMGAAVGRELAGAGTRVVWCAAGRSEATARRAREAGLEPVPDLAALAAASDLVVSLCPPAAAEEVAAAVAATGFDGVFVEANAISPARTRRIASLFGAVLDGCVIGPPPSPSTGARLYLSGEPRRAAEVAALFTGTAVEAVVIEGEAGRASALKMAFGSYNKASAALAAVSHALADAHGVGDELMAEARHLTLSPLAAPERLPSAAARAWRWAPEMEEGASTFRDAGLPDDLARAAAAVFERWAPDRDDFEISLADALAHLRRPG